MAEFCFIGKKCEESDKTMLFADTNVLLPILETETNMAHLLARIGKFSSVKDAKRNGWDRPIPTGWAEFTIGKGAKRTDVYIWNPTCTLDEFDEEEFDRQNNII
jgi:hypothetical protein